MKARDTATAGGRAPYLRMMLTALAVTVLCTILLMAALGVAAADAGPRIAVKLAPGCRFAGASDDTLRVVRDWPSLASRSGTAGLPLKVSSHMGGLGITVLEAMPAGDSGPGASPDVQPLVRALRLTPGVVWAEEAHPMTLFLTPNDPQYAATAYSVGQWVLDRVGLPKAWDTSTGSRDVTVAFIDSGLNGDAPDFAGRIVSPYNAVVGSSAWLDWQDVVGHGTAVAGVAAAQGNDGLGMAGGAWNVGIMPVRVATQDGYIDDLAVARAIQYAADHGADVVNMSLGAQYEAYMGQSIKDAVAYALKKGVVIVAAAGNDDYPFVSFPAALPGVIAVGATNRKDTRWSDSIGGSNGGTDLDLMAPGTNVLTYVSGSMVEFGDDNMGTSFACPIVTAVVALMLSVNPALSPQQVTDILTSTADDLGPPGWDGDYGWGIVDAGEAVAHAAAEGTETTTTSTTSTTTTSTTVGPRSPRFADVSPKSTPYWQQIEYLAGIGVVIGSSDGLFHPQEGLKRQQFAKMIVLALNIPTREDQTCPFVDLVHTAGDPYPYHYVAASFQRGIVQGTDATHFSPYASLSRAQLITMVARAAQLPEPPAGYQPNFKDFSPTHYPAARKAAYAGLLESLVGMGPSYDFLAPAGRGEVCALLYALLQ